MKAALIALLTLLTFSLSAQTYNFPHISQSAAQQIPAVIDTLFAEISSGHVLSERITGQQKDLTREMLEYLKNRQGEDIHYHIINCYMLNDRAYRVMIANKKADTLRQIYTFDIRLKDGRGTVDLPLWYDTRNWVSQRIGTIHYYYDHDFDLKAAHAFDKANHQIAAKLNLVADTLDFYLADNYQQIMQWLGLTYDQLTTGNSRDGFNIEQTIFAIQHSEDFSHDLVHYYVYKVRKGPRNSYAEEGVAYYWGNAYYTNATGQMITLEGLKNDLRIFLSSHPDVDLLSAFRQNQRGLFGPAPEVSVRSTLSGIIAEAIERKYGVDGVLKLLNCGAGESNYFAATQSLLGINPVNFNQRVVAMLENKR